MSIGLVVILLLVFGMMTWPILLLKPRPEQKKREALYAKAAALGLKIQHRAPVLPSIIQERYRHLAYNISFSKAIAHGVLDKTYIALRNPETNEWFWPNKERPHAAILQALLNDYANLPASCLAVEHGLNHTTLFVADKQLDIDALPALIDSLNRIISKPLTNKKA